jgi:hypothetical protein
VTTLQTPTAVTAEPTTVGTGRVFWAVLRRDLYVTWRELPVFLAQVVGQPLFMLFVFGRVLADLGFTRPGYTEVLFPGIVALTTVLTALQSTALPLVIDFSYTKEIEDRLLAPMPVGMVALEKVVFAALRAVVAAAVLFPVGILILGSIPWRAGGVPPALVPGRDRLQPAHLRQRGPAGRPGAHGAAHRTLDLDPDPGRLHGGVHRHRHPAVPPPRRRLTQETAS